MTTRPVPPAPTRGVVDDPPAGPSVGLDLGERRIGVATGDTAGRTAVPSEVLERTGDRASDHRRIGRVVRELEAAVVVVGLPLSLDGSVGPAARRVLEEVEQLRSVLDVPVATHDERFSTAEAHASLRDAGLDERARRRVVDAVAASVILQGWLDGRRNRQDLGP